MLINRAGFVVRPTFALAHCRTPRLWRRSLRHRFRWTCGHPYLPI